ncbi:uncharacterized protein LOC126106208 [Schistocerca cancellata]|uniref:uncharacterized protein LOC126106208 n=1 Tax=Schistocerca cancellata TaxID=274614 RepID=UPI00211849BF|nr:uncharacterized protein LOC126106208 [Schistocerca cancellata]
MVLAEINTGNFTFPVLNTYFQYRHRERPYTDQLKEPVGFYRYDLLICTMDENDMSPLSHSDIKLLGARRTARRGERLAEAIYELGLEVLNRPNFPSTYEGRREATSNIVVTLKSAHALLRVENWKVWSGMTLIDHNLTTFTVAYDGEPPQDRVNGIVKYNWRKADWDRLRGNLMVADWPMDRVVDVDKAAEDLTVAIQTVARGAVLLAHTGKTPTAPWNPELQRLRRKFRRVRRHYQRSIGDHMCEATVARSRWAKVVFKLTLHMVWTESWQTIVRDSLAADPCGTPYKIAALNVRSPTVLSTQRKIDGSHTCEWQVSPTPHEHLISR